MNKSFYNQDNIDAYLTNQLSGAERKVFESGLAKDPLILNEVNLQKEIIESLKETRKAELKNRLNNIDIESGTNFSFKLKVAASVLIILSLLSGTYFFTRESATEPVFVQAPVAQKEQKSLAIEPRATHPSTIPLVEDVENTTKSQNFIPQSSITNNTLATKSAPENTNVDIAEIKSPVIKENFEDEDIKTESNIVVPEGNVIENEHTYKSDVELSIQPNGENKFHYQYYSNKLYLFCDFQSKPYELLEWNTKKTKQLYLYFNQTYYELKHTQAITPLKAINDKQLIKQLEGIKDK